MGRFAYVRYDSVAVERQTQLKAQFEIIEKLIDSIADGDGCTTRAKDLAFQYLENCYAWCGKAIRDEQVGLRGDATPQEARTNS